MYVQIEDTSYAVKAYRLPRKLPGIFSISAL